MIIDVIATIGRRVTPVFAMLRLAPGRGVSLSIASLVLALLEGVSLAALIPLIALLGQDESQSATATGVLSLTQNFIPIPLNKWMLFAAFVGLLLLRAGIRFVVNNIMNSTASQLMYEARVKLVRSYLSADWIRVRDTTYGEMASLGYDGIVYGVGGLFNGSVAAMTTLLQIIVYGALLLLLDWGAAALGVIGMLFLVLPMLPLYHRHHENTGLLLARYASITTFLVDLAKTAKSLIAMRGVQPVVALVETSSQFARRDEAKAFSSQSAIQALMEPLIAVFAIGMALILSNGGRAPAMIVVVMVALLRLMMLLAKLQAQVMALARFEINTARLHSFIAAMERASDDSRSGKSVHCSGRIELNDLSVVSEQGIPILSAVSVSIPPCSFVVICGASGSGKTTLIDCILGLRPPDKGQIRIAGELSDTLDYRRIREQVGYVQQATLLFNGSIRENLALFAPEASDSDLLQALAVAEAREFVDALPDRLDTELAEGGAPLSGGQCQRLSIARALLRKPRLLILDEATSALDRDTGDRIFKNLAHLRDDMTILMISHEPNAFRHADLVIRLENGRLVLPTTEVG